MTDTVDLQQDLNTQVREAIEAWIANGTEIGVQCVAYLGNRLVVNVSAGLADPETGRAVTDDTLFNVYSVTKAVVATALHIQADRGLIDYDARVADYWPEYAANGKEATTVRDVLTHRSGLAQMPEDTTPALICDWDAMVTRLAVMPPLAPPGAKGLYQSMTHGWLVGELVRRTDPQHRSIGRFVREEIAEPLGIGDLWVGLPESEMRRVAKMTLAMPAMPQLPDLYLAAMPPQVDLVPSVFEQPPLMRAEVAGVGGIFNALSTARFFAMLANGGELDGVGLLSAERVARFNNPRPNADEPDIVIFGMSLPLGEAGYWLGQDAPPTASAKYRQVICHPGAGNSQGFADLKTGLAFAWCHNRMYNPYTREEDPTAQIADLIRAGLGLD
jgi:CubicO group peptidase (beta-lactamase class C family)